MAYLMLVISLLIGFVVALFAIQNSMAVNVVFGGFRLEASLAFVILGAAAAGLLVGLFFDAFIQIKLRLRIFQRNQQIHHLEKEIEKYKKTETAKPGG